MNLSSLLKPRLLSFSTNNSDALTEFSEDTTSGGGGNDSLLPITYATNTSPKPARRMLNDGVRGLFRRDSKFDLDTNGSNSSIPENDDGGVGVDGRRKRRNKEGKDEFSIDEDFSVKGTRKLRSSGDFRNSRNSKSSSASDSHTHATATTKNNNNTSKEDKNKRVGFITKRVKSFLSMGMGVGTTKGAFVTTLTGADVIANDNKAKDLKNYQLRQIQVVHPNGSTLTRVYYERVAAAGKNADGKYERGYVPGMGILKSGMSDFDLKERVVYKNPRDDEGSDVIDGGDNVINGNDNGNKIEDGRLVEAVKEEQQLNASTATTDNSTSAGVAVRKRPIIGLSRIGWRTQNRLDVMGLDDDNHSEKGKDDQKDALIDTAVNAAATAGGLATIFSPSYPTGRMIKQYSKDDSDCGGVENEIENNAFKSDVVKSGVSDVKPIPNKTLSNDSDEGQTKPLTSNAPPITSTSTSTSASTSTDPSNSKQPKKERRRSNAYKQKISRQVPDMHNQKTRIHPGLIVVVVENVLNFWKLDDEDDDSDRTGNGVTFKTPATATGNNDDSQPPLPGKQLEVCDLWYTPSDINRFRLEASDTEFRTNLKASQALMLSLVASDTEDYKRECEMNRQIALIMENGKSWVYNEPKFHGKIESGKKVWDANKLLKTGSMNMYFMGDDGVARHGEDDEAYAEGVRTWANDSEHRKDRMRREKEKKSTYVRSKADGNRSRRGTRGTGSEFEGGSFDNMVDRLAAEVKAEAVAAIMQVEAQYD